jgi:hypothetical protein
MGTHTPPRSLTEELRDAGPTVDLTLANRALGISKGHGYALAKRGDYPVKLLKLGGSYRVVTADLLAVLGLSVAAWLEEQSDEPRRVGAA